MIKEDSLSSIHSLSKKPDHPAGQGNAADPRGIVSQF
jgi:hypothetical protein